MTDGHTLNRESQGSTTPAAGNASVGFPPIAHGDARILILGSIPGRTSLAAGEYYAHPRNAFWKIMRIVCGVRGGYRARCECLMERNIAVWDVLKHSVRPGSMDADIRLKTAMPNDFAGFFAAHSRIELVCFNGKKSEQLFHSFVSLEGLDGEPMLAPLPSTSPAYASLSFEQKLVAWRDAIARWI